jgi:hypothetical protein
MEEERGGGSHDAQFPTSSACSHTKESPNPHFNRWQPNQKSPQIPTSPAGNQTKRALKSPPHLRATNPKRSLNSHSWEHPKSSLPKNTLHPTSHTGNKTREVSKSPLHLRESRPKRVSNPHSTCGQPNQKVPYQSTP